MSDATIMVAIFAVYGLIMAGAGYANGFLAGRRSMMTPAQRLADAEESDRESSIW
jgi:hypothetical protein